MYTLNFTPNLTINQLSTLPHLLAKQDTHPRLKKELQLIPHFYEITGKLLIRLLTTQATETAGQRLVLVGVMCCVHPPARPKPIRITVKNGQ